jgi:putative flippase GtrA
MMWSQRGVGRKIASLEIVLQAIQYSLAGAAQTIVGYSIFALCLFGLGFSPVQSNLVAYGFGLVVAFTLMRRWVFPSQEKKSEYVAKFVAIFAVSYLLNLATLFVLLEVTTLAPGWAQILAMAVYAAAFFLLGRRFLMKRNGQ